MQGRSLLNSFSGKKSWNIDAEPRATECARAPLSRLTTHAPRPKPRASPTQTTCAGPPYPGSTNLGSGYPPGDTVRRIVHLPMDARVWIVGGNNISECDRDESLRPAQSKFRSKKFFGPYLTPVWRKRIRMISLDSMGKEIILIAVRKRSSDCKFLSGGVS
jgi:hypothetical protein